MTLAGSIRLRTFLLGAGTLSALIVGLVGWQAWSWLESRPEPVAATAPVIAPPPVSSPPSKSAAPSDRAFDAALIGMLGKDLGTDKKKDILPGGPKINVYQDVGHKVAHRAKVDLDRDENDDEKWSFDDGKITRQVSPADDGKYTETWTWGPSGWTRTDPGAPQPAPTAAAPGGRPVDQDLMGWKGRDLGTDKVKDATAGKPYKINLYQDAGALSVNRAKLDLDRDDKWDEKITFEANAILREVAPADDEQYTETWHWDGSGWAKGK